MFHSQFPIQVHDTYGELTTTSGSSQTVFGFTGEETDGTGQVYLRARYYNPSIGQFFSLDPLEGMDSAPMSLNHYNYVQGNVVNWVDPSGLVGEQPSQWDSCQYQSSQAKCITPSILSSPRVDQTSKVERSKIDPSLFSSWGVLLTVQCDGEIPTTVSAWQPNEVSRLTRAFGDVNKRLMETTGFSFLAVFGGLEIRAVLDLGQAGAQTSR